MNKGIFRKMAAAGLALMMLIALAPSMGLANSPIYFTVTYSPNSPINQDPMIDSTMGFYTVWNNPFSSPPGYAFNGWNTQADGSGTRYAPGKVITVTEPLTLYAQWKPIATPTVTITYKSNVIVNNMYSEPDVKDIVIKGSSYTLRDNPFGYPRTHTFIGWNTKANGSGKNYKPGKAVTANGNCTLYAQWKVMETVTITYKPNNSVSQADVIDPALKGNSYTLKDNPFAYPRTHVFIGWNTKANGSGKAYKPGQVLTATGNHTLYAQWKAIKEDTVAIVYKANFGDNQADVTDIVTIDSDYSLKTNPFTNPNSHIFVGWNTQPDGSGTDYQEGQEVATDGDYVLYAQWQFAPPPDTVTITYKAHADDSQLDFSETVTRNSLYAIKNYQFAIIDIYIFQGWNTEPDGTGMHYLPKQEVIVSDDLTLYAQFSLVY